MNKYVEWVNDHLTNSSLHIATLDELSEGRQFLSIMQQMTHTITATDKPLAKAIQLAEKRFGKLDGLDMKKIEEGDEKQIIAFIDLIKREEKSNAIKIQNTLSRSDSMIMSSRRRAFTVKKDGKTVPVFRNEPTVGSPSKLTQSNGQQIGRTLIAPLNLKQVINNKKEEKKSPRTPKNSNNKTPHSPHNEDNKKSPRTIQKEEREARREMKRKQIEMEKENLRKLEETRKAKTLKKEELQRMKNEMQEAIENDDETFLDLEFSSEENEIIEEEEEEEIKEVYNGVFLLDDKYYVVDPDGDGSELMELIICDVNEDVTAMARTLLISTSYQEDQIKQVKHLESVSNSITTKQVNNIIALQTQIRLWEAKQLPEIPSMKERYNMMKELKESERKYLDNLKILQTHYLKKLLEEKDDKIIKNCLKNLEMIIKYNETFIKDLTNDNKVNMYGKGVGGVFKKFTGFMKCYTLYINSHEVTNDHIVALKKKKTFAGLLTKLTTSPEVKNQTIFSYLILPIQRIPRYELFIRGMLKNIPKWSDEFGQLKEILELINKTASYLNERRREMEYKTQLKKFKHNLIIKKFDLLDKDTRRLCKYSSLECEEYGHVILFLLNDIFLIHKAKQSYSDIDALIEKTKLKIKHVVPLVGVGIFHISETSFQVTSKIGSLTFTTATSNEKNDWMNAFDEVLAREQSSAVSRLNAFRQTQEVQTTKVDTIYFEGYLKTSLKMFEKYVGSVVKFHPSVNIKKKDSGSNLTQNSTKMYNSPRNDSIIRPSPQIGLISPRLTMTFRTPRYYRIQNDHDEEKQRFVTVDGEFMTFFQSVSDAIENKWHMKVALNGISVESGVVINRPASFRINISGKYQILDAPNINAKWKWISVLRASFYASSKDCLTTQKIIPNAKEIKYYSPPPPLVCSERGPYASFLDLLLNSPTNSVCCDCGDNKLSYADVTYGVFLCRDCSTLHKNLLKSQIIHIKTLYCKTKEDVFLFKNKGNAFVNGVVEKNMPESISRPSIEDLKNSMFVT